MKINLKKVIFELTEKDQHIFLVIDALSLLFLRFRYAPRMMGQNIIQLK
jgi:hypothetical protein